MSFPARYSGPCAAKCGEPIALGDDIAYVDRELMHEACSGEGVTLVTPSRVVCQTCWIEIAANGTCLC